jgi:hypothetical protein
MSLSTVTGVHALVRSPRRTGKAARMTPVKPYRPRMTVGLARRHRLVALVVLAVLAVTLAWAGQHIVRVRMRSGEWRWSPSATPPKIVYDGRDYLRGATFPRLPEGEVRLVRLATGAWLYGPPLPHANAPTGLDVIVDGRVVGYGLSGGP